MSQFITAKVTEIARPIVEQEGFLLSDVEYKKEGQEWFLRIFLKEKDTPVDLDVCSLVSEQISKVLDEEDPIPNAYFLEVSSEGTERSLKDKDAYFDAIGKNVQVSLYEPLDGKKRLHGILTKYENDHLFINIGEQEIGIPIEKVANTKLDGRV